ncbi:hypothetical protein BKA57DRAFT_478974 [Linnemannia elongata]|nr:hypothetical protein BKA57DRAFT_478974 [Linnemannia elongata]
MRTAELIALLRSHDRNKPNVRDHLAMLDHTRQLHLLGELANWLLVELHKYQDRQTGPNDLETLQQGSIHSQIRHTLKAIIVVLQSVTATTNVNGRSNDTIITNGSNEAASTSPIDVKKKTAVPLDDRGKEKILDNFLTPLLIGTVPLGPRVDSTDVQFMCAKILSFCTNPLTTNSPFPPQDFAKRMMSVSPSNGGTGFSSQPPSSSKQRRRGGADVVLALSSLLRSSSIKLQEYGLRILTSHKLIVQEKLAWEILPALRSVLEELRKDLSTILTGSMSLFQADQDIEDVLEDPGVGAGTSNGQRDGGDSGKPDETSFIGVRSRGLLLLQSFQQEAGRHSKSTILLQQSHGSDKLKRLREAAPMSLLVELWKELQQIFFFDKAALPSCDRLVLVLCGAIYWTCWIFQEKDSAMAVLLEEGMDTLLAWYGYYIISHDDDDQDQKHVDKDKGLPAGNLTQDTAVTRKEAVLKHQASVLEYLTKLIVNLVSNKNHHAALYSGYPRPVGLTIMRRTIEFFNDIPTTSTSSAATETAAGSVSSSPPLSSGNGKSINSADNSIAVSLIRLKPGILEAMLGVVSGCFGANKASEDLTVYSRVPNVLVMLLSEPATRDLFGTPSKELPEATSRRYLHLALNLLPGFLKYDGAKAWIENVNWNEWTVGYTALVDRIMRPLDQEAEKTRTWILEERVKKDVTNGYPFTPDLTPDAEMGLKALKVFALFWKCYPKGRWLLSDIFGPRFFQFQMLYVLTDLRDDSFITAGAGDVMAAGGSKWVQERALLLVDAAVYLGTESNIRFNMREQWNALPFLVALLGGSLRRLSLRGYSIRETHCRRIAQRCFYALRNFWLDRQGLTQLVDLDLGAPGGEEEMTWWNCMPSTIKSFSATAGLGGSVALASIVPLLLSILAPPKTEWSSDLLLGGTGQRSKWWHPLFEREESILVEASLLLAQIAPLPTCQHRLVSKPGVIWMLSRMMVERSLVGTMSASTRHRRHRRNKADTEATAGGDANVPKELIEKSLFETLSKVMTSEESAKAVVSNNSITELFAAVLETDQPLRFYRDKPIFELIEPKSTAQGPAEEHEGEEHMEEESAAAAAADEPHDDQEQPPNPLRPLDLILPTHRHQELHQQLLRHFQTVMLPLRGQFERIYQYVGGRRQGGLVEADETADSVFWLREYCAIVFMYTLDPPSSGSVVPPPSPWVLWGPKIEKKGLLESESVLGVVCRMLTLEMEYDDNDGVVEEAGGMEGVVLDESEVVDTKSVQKEEALLRRLSSGLAFQAVGWRHTDRWRKQHLELVETYSEVMTKEWEAHVANLVGPSTDAAITKDKEPTVPISFLVQDRTITFPDRMCLSRASPFFYTLLLGDFRESNQQQIALQDVEPDDIELLLEILRESRMTAQHLLPEDMPFEMVIRLMVCADRFMVGFVRRLAEVWILDALGRLEVRCYDLQPTRQSDVGGKDGAAGLQTTWVDGTKRVRNDDGLMGGSGIGLGGGIGVSEKRPRLDPSVDIDLVNGINQPITEVANYKNMDTQKQQPSNAAALTIEANDNNEDDDSGSSEGKQSPKSPTSTITADDEEDPLTIQDCLLMVYEACSHPRLGSIYSSTHPFHNLLWDILRRIMLRLGSIAMTPRFARMLNQGGEERIQEFLQILYELATDETDSYLIE